MTRCGGRDLDTVSGIALHTVCACTGLCMRALSLFWNPVPRSCDIWLALSLASSGCDCLVFHSLGSLSTAQVSGGCPTVYDISLAKALRCPHPGGGCTAFLCVALTVTSVGSEVLTDIPSPSLTHLHQFSLPPTPPSLHLSPTPTLARPHAHLDEGRVLLLSPSFPPPPSPAVSLKLKSNRSHGSI